MVAALAGSFDQDCLRALFSRPSFGVWLNSASCFGDEGSNHLQEFSLTADNKQSVPELAHDKESSLICRVSDSSDMVEIISISLDIVGLHSDLSDSASASLYGFESEYAVFEPFYFFGYSQRKKDSEARIMPLELEAHFQELFG